VSNTGPEGIAQPAGRGDGGAGLRPVGAGAGQRREEKPPVTRLRWALWWALLAPALVLFYVIFLPAWLGIRIARLVADLKARQMRRSD
jgi:hypothetical protein